MPVKRYPAHDPRSWDLTLEPRSRVIAKEAPVSGQWVEDRRERSGWRWDATAPAGDPSPTMIRNAPVIPAHELGSPRRDPAMSEPQSDDLVAFDPNDPHDPSIESPQGFERPGGGLPLQDPVLPDVAACPTCGTVVSRDRLR